MWCVLASIVVAFTQENDDFQPPKKRLKLPASLKGNQRFTEMVSSEELESISKGFVHVKNTKRVISTVTFDCFTKSA